MLQLRACGFQRMCSRQFCVSRIHSPSTCLKQVILIHSKKARAMQKQDAVQNSSSTQKSSLQRPLVEEVMAPNPIVLKESMPVRDAVRLLLEKNISGAPVVNESGKLVGILSESDLIWKGAGSPQDHFIIPPVFIGFADAFVYLRDNKQFEDECHKILAKTVGEAMTRNPVSISRHETMERAATVMLQKQVNRLPVLENGAIVGVVTCHDILKGMVDSNSPYL